MALAPELAESVEWVRRAAEGGLGLAMSRLAAVLRNGKGVPRDDAAAALWYRQVSRGLKTGRWGAGREGGGFGSCLSADGADRLAWPAPWRVRATLSLSLSMNSTYACLPPLWSPLWQAIDASNEPAAHCGLGQMLWERTAFPSTPHRSAPEEATARLAIVSKSPRPVVSKYVPR